MRFFEIDLGSARSVLKVLQDLANEQGRDSELPFGLVQHAFSDFDYAIGNGGPESQKALQAIFKDIDPQGKVVAEVTPDGTVILNTDTPSDQLSPGVGQPTGPSVDQMAAHNSKSVTR